jgi:threonine dehydrogenase-like Zn-dependent dehydrogenase
MRAVQIVGRREVEIVEVEEPKLGESELNHIKIRVEKGCLCGSDVPFFEYDLSGLESRELEDRSLIHGGLDYDGENIYPLRPGLSLHECLGTVVESTGTRFREGDYVLAIPNRHDGFLDYFSVAEDRAIDLPRNGVGENEILLSQPLGTVICACRKFGNILDKDIVVLGQGPIGLLFDRLLRNMGARKVIAVDKIESRLGVARKMLATDTINPDRDDLLGAVRELTDGRMAHIVVEAAGHQTETINTCIEVAANRGTVMAFGAPDTLIYEGFQFLDFFRKNLTLISSVGPDIAADCGLARDMIASGLLPVTPLVTDCLPLSDAQSAYEIFSQRRNGAIKVFIDFRAGRE